MDGGPGGGEGIVQGGGGCRSGMNKDREGCNWVTEDWGAGGRWVMRMR